MVRLSSIFATVRVVSPLTRRRDLLHYSRNTDITPVVYELHNYSNVQSLQFFTFTSKLLFQRPIL